MLTRTLDLHRFTYFLFEQEGQVDFSSFGVHKGQDIEERTFSLRAFAEKYKLNPKGLVWLTAKWHNEVKSLADRISEKKGFDVDGPEIEEKESQQRKMPELRDTPEIQVTFGKKGHIKISV